MISLYKNVDFDNTYQHTLYADTDTQTSYFSTRLVVSFDDTVFMRKNFEVRVNLSYEYCWTQGINYCIINNGNKDYYYFIVSKQYINDVVTELRLDLDVLQTYLYDVDFKKCLVEREHVTDDSIGANLVDEGLPTGEYVINNILEPTDLNLLTKILSVNGLQVAGNNPTGSYAEGHNFTTNGIKCDKQYIGYREGDNIKALEKLNGAGQLQYISDLFYYPTALLSFENDVLTPGQWELGNRITGGKAIQWGCGSYPTTLNGYTPHNKKLFTYPYCFAELMTCGKGSKIYKYEYFTNNAINFQLQGACTEDTIVQAVPKNYKGYAFNINEIFESNNYPHIPVTTNNFENYLARKSTDIIASSVHSVINAMTSFSAGAIVGGLVSSLDNILLSQNPDNIPSTISGDMTGIITKAYNNTGFRLLKKSITSDYAKVIDSYFDMYGYKVNKLKTPQLYTRTKCNYIKTNGCKITGNIDFEDLTKIQDIFNNGVTLWHTETAIKNHDYTSNEVRT